MAELGEDFKIYDPLYTALTRTMKGKQPSTTAQREVNYLKNTTTEAAEGEGQATSKGTLALIGESAGDSFAQANTEDVNTRYLRAINDYRSSLYESEKRFMDRLRTHGMNEALNMFTSQFGAQTDIDVAGIQNDITANQANQMQNFVGQQSELDRLLEMELFQGEMALARQKEKKEKKRGLFGFLGNALGAGLGIALAPLTGGASLASTALTAPKAIGAFGGGTGMSGGGLLGRY